MNKKIIFLEKANKFVLSNKMKYIDWSLAIGCLAYGIYLLAKGESNYIFWLIGGGIGAIFSYVRPANKIHDKITKNLTNKKS